MMRQEACEGIKDWLADVSYIHTPSRSVSGMVCRYGFGRSRVQPCSRYKVVTDGASHQTVSQSLFLSVSQSVVRVAVPGCQPTTSQEAGLQQLARAQGVGWKRRKTSRGGRGPRGPTFPL